MILDVGCGIHPQGDINVDLKSTKSIVDSHDSNMITKFTKANVYASACYLPFRDSVFNVVRFSGVLHHIKDSKKAWNEILRVASDIVYGLEPCISKFIFLRKDMTEPTHFYFRKRDIVKVVGKGATIKRIVMNLFQVEWSIVQYKRNSK